MAESFPNEYLTLWEKEKLLVMNNFSFSHSVFKRLVLQTGENQGLFGKGLRTQGAANALHLVKAEFCSVKTSMCGALLYASHDLFYINQKPLLPQTCHMTSSFPL